jgi:hypothetical protein
MVIPGPEVEAQARPEERYHLLLYSGDRYYFLHADEAGILEAPALSSGGVAGDENEVTLYPLLIVPSPSPLSNEMPPDRHMVAAKETTRATPVVVMCYRDRLGECSESGGEWKLGTLMRLSRAIAVELTLDYRRIGLKDPRAMNP